MIIVLPDVYADLVHTLGTGQGSGNGQLDQPWGLGVNSTGHVFVAEYWNHRVSVFDKDGNFKQLIINNGKGSGDGQLNEPQDVELDSSGNIWVLEVQNHRVQKFDKEGNFLLKFGSYCQVNPDTGVAVTGGCNSSAPGASVSGDGQFYSPHDLVIDSSNNIWVVDMNNYRIQKFDSSGNFLSKFGSKGCQVIQNDGTITGETHNGKFCTPQSIAMDDSDNLYITDANNRRVQKFDSSGTFVSQFGSYGNSDGKFIGPHYLELDDSGNIYVGDRERNNVQVFSPSFNFKYAISGFSDPKDIVIDSSNRLNVAFNHGVKVFEASTVEVGNGETTITFSSSYYEAVLNSTNFNALTTINVQNSNPNASLNFTKILSNEGGGSKSITFSNDFTINADSSDVNVDVFIPTGTKITGSNWDGLFKLVNSANTTDISLDGQSIDVAKKFGHDSTSLSFSKPVKLTFESKAGKNAGYVSGSTTDTISQTCNGNTLSAVTSQLSGTDECKIDSGNDLVIWTNHFTTFFTSTSTSTSTSTGTSSSSGGHKTHCDSKGFGIGQSLQVYEISYDIETELVSTKAYSTCGVISAKVSTSNGQKILGLSSVQPYLDEKMVVYSGHVDKTNEKFTIILENNRQSFVKTFYIHDSSIIREYSTSTTYTSEQQGDISEKTDSTEEMVVTIPEPMMDSEPSENLPSVLESDKIVDVKLSTSDESVEYIPEPIPDQPQCGNGTFVENGICKVIVTDEPEFCFWMWCW